MSLLTLIETLADRKPEPFVAPIPAAERVSVRTIQDGIPYTFSVQNPRPGWWQLTPANRVARIDSVAQPAAMIDYLNALPRFYVIAQYATSDTTWLVVPYSNADAEQRGWRDGQPREVHLVRMSVEPYDILVTRSLAGLLIFDDIDTRLNTHLTVESLRQLPLDSDASHPAPEFANAIRTMRARYQQLLKEQEAENKRQQAATVVGRMSTALEFMGAKLIKADAIAQGYLVDWQAPDGHTYRMKVGHNLHIEVAGFCLAGTDREHDLSSIVAVMEEAHERRRPDIRGAYLDSDQATMEGEEDEEDWDD